MKIQIAVEEVQLKLMKVKIFTHYHSEKVTRKRTDFLRILIIRNVDMFLNSEVTSSQRYHLVNCNAKI